MHLKVHDMPGESTITALCDSDLIGTTLKGEYCDMVIDDDFYGVEEADIDEIKEALMDAVNANIVGKESCALAVGMGLVRKEACIEIAGVPHAQIYRI